MPDLHANGSGKLRKVRGSGKYVAGLIVKKDLIAKEYAAGLIVKKYLIAKKDLIAKKYVAGLIVVKANKKSSSAANKPAKVNFGGGGASRIRRLRATAA